MLLVDSLFLLKVNVITLSLMTALDPITFERNGLVYNDQFGRPETTYGQCVWKTQIPYIVTLFVLNFLIALLSAYQSWKARKLSTEFAESQYIFASLIITLTLFMVAVPIIIMSRSNPRTSVFIYSAAVFICKCDQLICTSQRNSPLKYYGTASDILVFLFKNIILIRVR